MFDTILSIFIGFNLVLAECLGLFAYYKKQKLKKLKSK